MTQPESVSPDAYPRTDDIPLDGVPIRPAATLLLLDDRPDLHVLTLRRTTRSTFVADHTLFPGGALDPDDSDDRWPDLVRGLTPGEADDALGTGPGALAFWIAAVRETIEEVGIAVGLDTAVVAHRSDLDTGRVRFSDLEVSEGLDLSGIHPVARWVTPTGGPKRYDTFFFVAAAPSEAEPVADGTEAVAVDWMRPADALDRWRAGELTMISPTISMLQCLEGFETSADALEAATAAKGAPRRRARILDESMDLVRFPGDPGYEAVGTREALGWVWLPSHGGCSGTTAP
jgi:8-oxo-dGTP pyrophosphatase MutT (NUDIX family)